ncbi:hypothetical protein NDU88_004314 [Pleurodeles waltl]|uniref:Uncharacterized protein n=1 Tax=Pleurodeles waltl TaxID=8319 RepID=A0AAV7V2N2_PLEWA|nr:hypothetical protein NDU88_004314 [Pleurodeles waltl]
MHPLAQWVLSDPAWLRFSCVSALVLATVVLWVVFLSCSLRGPQPALYWTGAHTGKHLSERRCQPRTESKRKKPARQKEGAGEAKTKPAKDQRGRKTRKTREMKRSLGRGVMQTYRQELKLLEKKVRMEEENESVSSGSPTPGDTLPWNLSKNQRTKRSKSASGSGIVLDAAERAVIRIAGGSCEVLLQGRLCHVVSLSGGHITV